jgi:transposase
LLLLLSSQKGGMNGIKRSNKRVLDVNSSEICCLREKRQEMVYRRRNLLGLSSLAESDFKERVASGAFFVFLNKRRNMMKILYWDQDGLAIWHKRLEQGLFGKPSSKNLLNRREFLMLLEGITPKRINRRFSAT